MRTVDRSLVSSARALSLKPGVYLFKDAAGHVLYVGKALSLRRRVRQYLGAMPLDPAKQEMIARARAVETIVTHTDPEALALEATLIREHQPPYNVRLLDDSSYLYVKITNETYPKIALTRRILPDGAWYRGPFPNARAIRQTLKEARKVFPWCEGGGEKSNPCFAYHLGLCPGICVREISLEEYQRIIERLKRFLDGETREALRALRERMERLSAAQAYERAARVRDAIRAITQTTTPQNVATPRRESADFIGIARKGARGGAVVLQVRHGRVLGAPWFPLLHPPETPNAVILRGFTIQYYAKVQEPLTHIFLPERVEEQGAVTAWLKKCHGRHIRLATPRRGWKRKLLDIAATNAEEALQKSLTELTSPANLQKALHDLATALHLATPPRRIEAYDISNVQGVLATGSMVVFLEGKPAPSQYRKFHVVAEGTPNDVAMMKEVLYRRFRRYAGSHDSHEKAHPASESRVSRAPDSRAPLAGGGSMGGGTKEVPTPAWPLPDLVLLDGGKGQRNAGARVLREQRLAIALAALAKREEELFLPGQPQAIRLPKDSPALYLLQRIRDEAHRFTLGYHRTLRQTRMTRSLLEEVPGVGKATRKKLLRTFGSLRGIRAASPEDLARVVGRARADTLRAFLGSGG